MGSIGNVHVRGLFDKYVDNGDNFLFLIRKILKFLQ